MIALAIIFAASLVLVAVLLAGIHLGRVNRSHQVERWLRGNLLIMRVHASRVSPEALAVINCLESVEHSLTPVDGEQLEEHLRAIKRAKEKQLLESITSVSSHSK